MSEIRIETDIFNSVGKYINSQGPFTRGWSHYRCDKAGFHL